MKYRLRKYLKVPQNLRKLQRRSEGKRISVFLTLMPNETYDLYGDDDLFIQSISEWEAHIPYSAEVEEGLKAEGIPYHTKRGCACTGGKLNIYFPGVEVFE